MRFYLRKWRSYDWNVIRLDLRIWWHHSFHLSCFGLGLINSISLGLEWLSQQILSALLFERVYLRKRYQRDLYLLRLSQCDISQFGEVTFIPKSFQLCYLSESILANKTKTLLLVVVATMWYLWIWRSCSPKSFHLSNFEQAHSLEQLLICGCCRNVIFLDWCGNSLRPLQKESHEIEKSRWIFRSSSNLEFPPLVNYSGLLKRTRLCGKIARLPWRFRKSSERILTWWRWR